MNGSSAAGNCSSVTSTGVISTCTDPTSSVLFDGIIPTLDGDMWASQLLTLQRTTSARATLLFNFTSTPGYVGLSGRLEVVMFNCPEKGISASTIRVSTSSSPSVNPTLRMIDITSCDSLVRVCTQITTTQPSITLEFVIGTTFYMVYLAEVTFYADSSASTCPPDSIDTTDHDTTNTTPKTTTLNTTIPPTTPNTTTLNTPPPRNTTPPTPDTTTAIGSNITSVIVPVVVVICVVFVITGIMAAVFIGWRCRHKHKTSHRTALGEGHSIHSHPPPPVPPHQYQVGKKAAKKDTLLPLDKERSGVRSLEGDQLYAQVDENLKEELALYTSPLTLKVNTPAGIVHAQANKGKKKGEVATHSTRKKLTQK